MTDSILPFPAMQPGEVAVMLSESATGIVCNFDGSRHTIGVGYRYRVFGTVEEAEAFAKAGLLQFPEHEFVINDHTGGFLRLINELERECINGVVRRRIVAGRVAVTGTRIIIGDAWYPPRGTIIHDVPNGTYAVTAVVESDSAGERLTSLQLTVSEGGDEAEVVDFSIDGGVVAVADPAVEVPRWFERRRRRRAVEKEIMRGLKRVPPRSYYQSISIFTEVPWAVVLYCGDGIYDVIVRRAKGWVTSMSCTFKAK